MKKTEASFRPDSIGSYFRIERLPLALITVSGLAYNLGLLAGPWFEGRLAQCLADILGGRAAGSAMAILVFGYIGVTLAVQAARFVKRFYVRRFANNVNRRMKGVLYANFVRESRSALEDEGAGELVTKAISDVDDCAEGMRKFTTEVFDTGVALVGYVGMLLVYDWRLALARTLAHPRPILVLDDPFSALDRATEDAVFANLRDYARDKVVFLISHWLYHFPEMKKVVFLDGGAAAVGTHEELLARCGSYRGLYESQTGGNGHEEA